MGVPSQRRHRLQRAPTTTIPIEMYMVSNNYLTQKHWCRNNKPMSQLRATVAIQRTNIR